MRSFSRNCILILSSMVWLSMPSLAVAKESLAVKDLLTLVSVFDPTVDAQGQVGAQPDLDDKIRQGMRDLLLRLTGDPGVVNSPEGQAFVRQARSWLSRYYFEPRQEQGVTVGQNLYLVFDRARLLHAFQELGMVLWPSADRPQTLVMGSLLEGGIRTPLTQENLGYRPDVAFGHHAQSLALPVVVPSSASGWPPPLDDGLQAQTVQTHLSAAASDYLLSFQVERLAGGAYELHWQLYNALGQSVLQARLENRTVTPLFESMFQQLMQTYSYPYRQSAKMQGLLTLGVQKLSSAEQLIEVENYLKTQQPTLHQVFLQGVGGQRAQWQLVYQGRYQDVVRILSRIEGSELLEEDALSAQVELRMQGLEERPQTQLIDLSKEYDALQREGL